MTYKFLFKYIFKKIKKKVEMKKNIPRKFIKHIIKQASYKNFNEILACVSNFNQLRKIS